MFREEGRPPPGDCGHPARVWAALRPCLSGRQSPSAGKIAALAARRLLDCGELTSYSPTLGIDRRRLADETDTGKSKAGRVNGSVIEEQASQIKRREVVHIPLMLPWECHCRSASSSLVAR